MVFLTLGLLFFAPANLVPQTGQDPAALFQKVAASQFPDPSDPSAAKTPVIGFQVDLRLRDRGETAREIELEMAYRGDNGGHLRMAFHDAKGGERVQQGFDGKRYWLLDGNNQLQDLSSHEFELDRDRIDEAMDLCDELLLLLDIERLRSKAEDLTFVEGEAGGSALGGTISRFGKKWKFALHLNSDEVPQILDMWPPAPRSAPGEAQAEAPPKQRYQMLFYKDFEGRRIPQQINEFAGNETEFPVRMLELYGFRWRTPPGFELFEPNVKRPKQ